MAKYHNPKTGKTIEAKNAKVAKKRKPKKKEETE